MKGQTKFLHIIYTRNLIVKNQYFSLILFMIFISLLIMSFSTQSEANAFINAQILQQENMTKYEAEDAVLTGVNIAKSISGYSGTGYMDGGSFDNDGDKITFTVNVASAASYPLFIRFMNTCGACQKAQNISVNNGANKYTDFIGESATWQTLEVGDIELLEGDNTISISKSWGWTHIDYIGIGENDTIPPTAPTNLIKKDVLQTSFSLKWNLSSDNVGVKEYNIFFGNTLQATTADTTLAINNLTCNTDYPSITVKAKDLAGNISAASGPISVTTSECRQYALTVINGNGSGNFNSGKTITISADAAPSGQIFDKWTAADAVTNPFIAITTVLMPESDVVVTATYKNVDPTPLLDPAANSETVALWNYLKSVYGQKMLTGCWTESQFGGNDKVESCSGETPAIWGQDMNSWYRNRTEQNWINTWNSNIQGFKTAHKRGQILQVNWHWQMPSSKVNGVYTRDAWGKDAAGNVQMMTAQQWSDFVTPGTALYDAMIEDIDYHVVNFLKKIVDDNGNPIPIIFRPLHEIDGGWFWWTCTTDPTKTAKLFKIMQDRIINYHGVHNLIWVFNPAVVCNGTSWPPFQPTELNRRKSYYPGDEFCDITGIDLYDYDPAGRGTLASTGKTYRDAWNLMQEIAPLKMIALCEAEGMPNPDKCFTDSDSAPWLYCLPWFSEAYTDNTAGEIRDLCAWNKVQFKSDYVINAGDFILTEAKKDFQFNKQRISIYPNPVDKDLVIIKNPNGLKGSKVQISIHDIAGRIVLEKSTSISLPEMIINVQNLKPGVYFLEYKNENNRYVEKLIKQ